MKKPAEPKKIIRYKTNKVVLDTLERVCVFIDISKNLPEYITQVMASMPSVLLGIYIYKVESNTLKLTNGDIY